MEKTRVIFLIDMANVSYDDGVFAVFLGRFHTTQNGLVMYEIYQHIGQHSEASLGYLSLENIIEADPIQYEELYKELTEQVGYDLEVVQIKTKIC